MSDSLWSYGLQRARLPCPSLLVCGVYSLSPRLTCWKIYLTLELFKLTIITESVSCNRKELWQGREWHKKQTLIRLNPPWVLRKIVSASLPCCFCGSRSGSETSCCYLRAPAFLVACLLVSHPFWCISLSHLWSVLLCLSFYCLYVSLFFFFFLNS